MADHLTRETLAQLTRGELPRDEALAARRHLGACETCATALDALEHHREPERRLGRYLLLDEVGRGGMGQVLRGFDPQLDRFVAIKRLLDTAGGAEARERLVREAQAMARVVHPHLVSVFDAGLDPQGEVYLVMEYVKGPTLAQWLIEAPRAWREVLAHFRQAGEGLVAAHAAGLVHRDFKPSNVLVQGEVAKVTDFGLALAGAGAAPGPSTTTASTSKVSSRVTEAGVHAGTPAYMAPEQFAGRFDARSDQFSFARSLEESLAGKAAPRWVHDALRRALAVEADQRYPSMEALLDALAPERRARRTLSVVAVIAALALAGVMVGLTRARKVDCATAASALAPVWSDLARTHLDQVLAPLDARARDATRARFAGWAEQWRARTVGSCEASASGRQSEKVELLRRLCLDRRLGFFDTVLHQLAPGGVSAERVVSLELPDVGCTDEALLEAGAAEESEALRTALQPVRKQLDEVEALALVGKLDEATARAREVLPLAEATHHGPTVASAALMLGQRLSSSDLKASRALLERATREAGSVASPSANDARLAARAGLDLLDSWAVEPAAFEALRPLVEALIARAGGGPRWEAAYLTYQGRALVARGDAAAAVPALRRAYALRLELDGVDSERTETARVELAVALENAGELDEAVALRRASLEVAERVYGPRGLVTARARASLGGVEVVAVRYAEAERHLAAALEVLSSAGATEDLTTLLDNLASLAELRGDFAGAKPMRVRLLEKLAVPAARAKQLALLSRAQLETGDVAAARTAADQARSILEPINPRHPDLLVALTTLGRVTAGREGEVLLERALTLDSASDGEYRGDIERALGARTSGAARAKWWAKAKASYAQSEVSFRVDELK